MKLASISFNMTLGSSMHGILKDLPMGKKSRVPEFGMVALVNRRPGLKFFPVIPQTTLHLHAVSSDVGELIDTALELMLDMPVLMRDAEDQKLEREKMEDVIVVVEMDGVRILKRVS